jgi:signal transduction histidine kinase
MAPIIERLISLLSVPQANLVYAQALLFCSFAAWLSCIYARGKNTTSSGNRMQLGLLILVLAQLFLFVMSWLAWLGLVDSHTFLPPLDRTLAIFSLVLIIWLWAFPEPNRIFDALVALFEIITLLFGATAIVVWLREASNTYFNTSDLGAYAYYAGLALVILGLILLFLRRRSYWGYGVLMLALFLTGYLAQFVVTQPASDYTWFVHLGESAFIFLLVLPKRLVSPLKVPGTISGAEVPGPPVLPVDGKLLQSVADVVTETSPDKYYQELTRLVANMMGAEYCLLMIPPKTGEQLILPVAYASVQDKLMDGFTADGHKMPSILEALKNNRSLCLAGGKDSEVQVLSEELGEQHTGHLVLSPFQPKGTNTIMGIVLLSRPFAPTWTEGDATRLKDLTDTLIANIGRARVAGRLVEQGDLAEKLQRAEAHADQVRLEYAQLKARYDSISDLATASAAQSENEKALQEAVTRLENRNKELEALLARGRPSLEEVEQLRLELRAALADLARIPSTLSKSDQKMLETQLSAVKSLDKMQPTELVTSIAQEFRQPLSSIVGYTDLLLGESVGLLGAVQRKFVERVKASAERLGILLNELVEVMTIDVGKVDKTPVSVELAPVIQEAISNISAQLNDKNITIQTDLPPFLPAIQANKDAVLQILANLLENACLVTSQDGIISLSARVEQRQGEPDYILLSVSDQGGGIERTDISRVFMRRYKMENPLIKGVGDAGVGLSIVKSLVELLKGRVWVDSVPGGSVFSVLLPLSGPYSAQETKSNPSS